MKKSHCQIFVFCLFFFSYYLYLIIYFDIFYFLYIYLFQNRIIDKQTAGKLNVCVDLPPSFVPTGILSVMAIQGLTMTTMLVRETENVLLIDFVSFHSFLFVIVCVLSSSIVCVLQPALYPGTDPLQKLL